MTSEPSVVEVTLESDLKNVEVAEEIARRVAATAGFGEESEHQIEMALHESMINAIWHGNKNDASKSVWLRFEIYKDRLEIRVRDQGNGFNIAEVRSLLDRKSFEGFRPRDILDPYFYGRIPREAPSRLGNRGYFGKANSSGAPTYTRRNRP